MTIASSSANGPAKSAPDYSEPTSLGRDTAIAPAVPHWFAPAEGALLGWISRPSGATLRGAVIVPPVGYEYWTTHRTMRTIAESLALAGVLTLRYDHLATGDSAGSQTDSDLVESWIKGVGEAVGELRKLGADEICLVGIRLGASLALHCAASTGVEEVVAVATVTRPKQLRRELRMLGVEVPDDALSYPSPTLSVAGTLFTPETLDSLSRIEPLGATQLRRVLLIDRSERATEQLEAKLKESGAEVSRISVEDLDACLDRPTEYAGVPEGIAGPISEWMVRVRHPNPSDHPLKANPSKRPADDAEADPDARLDLDFRSAVEFPGGWSEKVVRIGPRGLIGVQTEPEGGSKATVVFLNSGSEHHVGPGRAWVEFARALAARGYTAVRVDWSGWGESPDLGHAPGRPYDLHAVEETNQIVEDLVRRGPQPVFLAGLCAGAWIALDSAPSSPNLAGVAALNPQLYWRPGDPVEADIVRETHVRRLPEIERFRRLGAYGVWDALDAVGLRPPAARQLRLLAQRGLPVLALFAEGDDGLDYLNDRVGRSWRYAQNSGRFDLQVVAGVDHPMHRHWMRSAVLETVHGWLERTVSGRKA